MSFPATAKPAADEVVRRLGDSVVIKPNDEGSSVGLKLPQGAAEIAAALAGVARGNWLAERRIIGRELSVGVLAGRAMGVVEIRPKSGVYDYTSKYTKGLTEYLAPAPLDPATTRGDPGGGRDDLRRGAAAAITRGWTSCFRRQDEPILLEINTLPGMKETSLLPMSARCAGLDFTALVRELVMPALQRFRSAIVDP